VWKLLLRGCPWHRRPCSTQSVLCPSLRCPTCPFLFRCPFHCKAVSWHSFTKTGCVLQTHVLQTASAPQFHPSAPTAELQRVAAETVETPDVDNRVQIREDDRRRQREHRQNIGLEVLNANREKDAKAKRTKRADNAASLLATANGQLEHHRAGKHVEQRLDMQCWSCWLLAAHECRLMHSKVGRITADPRQCRIASCVDRLNHIRPYAPSDSKNIYISTLDSHWGPDQELNRINAAYWIDSGLSH
jgi:hypothetical protein